VTLQRRFLLLLLGFCMVLAPLAAATVPRPSPEYAIKLVSGRQLLLSSYRGKVVALLFVSTDCPHCQDTCRLMESLQKEYGPHGFQTLAVAFNAMAIMLVPDFIKATGATYPVGYDSRDPVFAYLERSPTLLTYVPIIVFVDRKGTIRGQYLGDDNFMADRDKNIPLMIQRLLKEPVAGRRK